MSDDTPTRGSQTSEAHTDGNENKNSKGLILLLSIIGGLLLLAVIVLLTLLLSGRLGGQTAAGPQTNPSVDPNTSTSASPNETPSASPSAPMSESPSVSPSSAPPPPPPAATGPRFTKFVVPKTQDCKKGGEGPYPDPTRPNVTVSWSTAGADQAWFVNGTSDAADSGFMQIPLNGTQGDFQYPQQISCSADKATFTITLVGPDGKHFSKSWTVTLTGDRF